MMNLIRMLYPNFKVHRHAQSALSVNKNRQILYTQCVCKLFYC